MGLSRRKEAATDTSDLLSDLTLTETFTITRSYTYTHCIPFPLVIYVLFASSDSYTCICVPIIFAFMCTYVHVYGQLHIFKIILRPNPIATSLHCFF